MTAVENEPAIQGIRWILFTVTGEMDNVAAPKMRQDVLYSCKCTVNSQLNQKMARHMVLNCLKLLPCAREWVSTWNIGLYDDRQLELISGEWLIGEEWFKRRGKR